MGGTFGFLRSFGLEKLGQTGQSIAQKIVQWDPETASQAEIEEMIRELDKITVQAGKARADYDREKAEADAAQKNYDKYLAAAEILNSRLGSAQASGNQAEAQELTASLDKLVKELESLQPEVEREAKEAEEAKAYYDELKEIAEITAQKVRTAKSQLEQAKRDMRRAELDGQRAQARAEKAEQMAGLKTESSSLGVALAAMNKQAEQSRAIAEASDLKTRLLSTDKAKEDENIQAALQQVSSEPLISGASIADRLAALKKK
jgi:chromosome segregation ATPase